MERLQNAVVLSSGPALSLGCFSILAIQVTSLSHRLYINQIGKQNQKKQKTVPAYSPCKVNSRLVQWYLPLNMLKIRIITFLPKVVLPKAPRMAMLSIYMGPNQPHSGDQCRLSVSLPLPSTEMKYPFRLSCPSLLLSFHLHGLSSGLSISGCLFLFDLPASSLNLSNLLGTLAARVLPTNYRSKQTFPNDYSIYCSNLQIPNQQMNIYIYAHSP